MPEAVGSLIVLRAKNLPYLESFDYCDLSFAQTILLRIDEIAVIAVINDANSCQRVIQETLERIDGPLSYLQLRELAAHIAAINLHLAERPRFGTGLDIVTGRYGIGAEVPKEVGLNEWTNETLGRIMRYICGHQLPEICQDPQILEHLKTGRYGFIFNEKGEFRANHMDMQPTDE